MEYRCYFLSDTNRIEDVAEFRSSDDQTALEQARHLFEKQTEHRGFELWEGRRRIHSELRSRD